MHEGKPRGSGPTLLSPALWIVIPIHLRLIWWVSCKRYLLINFGCKPLSQIISGVPDEKESDHLIVKRELRTEVKDAALNGTG